MMKINQMINLSAQVWVQLKPLTFYLNNLVKVQNILINQIHNKKQFNKIEKRKIANLKIQMVKIKANHLAIIMEKIILIIKKIKL